MSKAKAQGTRWETEIVNRLNTHHINARRLPEGGTRDEGDIEFWRDGQRWIVEAKHRERLQPHRALHAAKTKAGDATTIIAWKRTVKKKGNDRRSADGEPEIIAMDMDTFLYLLDW